MDEINEDLNIYSEEVNEVLSDPPKSILLFGNTVLLGFIMLLLLLSWLLKYPDVIATQVTITTAIPPEKLVTKTSGKIEAILVKDRALVSENTPLAVIENAANYKDVFLLKSIVDTIDINSTNFPFEKLVAAQLGEIEEAYALFQKETSADELNDKLQPFKVETSAQSFEANQMKERLSLLESQQSITNNELELQKKDLVRYESLYKKGVISAQEIDKQRIQFLQSQKNYKNILNSISSLKSSLNELNRNTRITRINESKENVTNERNVVQAFYRLKRVIKDWELNYVLRSSIKGKLTYLQVWTENQNVEAGSTVFAIIPSDESSFIGKVKAPTLNSGKIKVGQEVVVRLANYPHSEFGVLNGRVKAISLTPDKDNNLLIDVALPDGLKTSYDKKLGFQQEMTGTADIVCEDLRLIERLLYQIRAIFK